MGRAAPDIFLCAAAVDGARGEDGQDATRRGLGRDVGMVGESGLVIGRPTDILLCERLGIIRRIIGIQMMCWKGV
jgi:hypothetical protein